MAHSTLVMMKTDSRQRLTQTEQDAIDQFCQRVHAAVGPQIVQMRLFGSRARGEGDEHSDVDLLVLTTIMSNPLRHAIWDIANDILLETDVIISPLVLQQSDYERVRQRERRIALEIERDGIVL